MLFYTFLHNLLNVLVEIAKKNYAVRLVALWLKLEMIGALFNEALRSLYASPNIAAFNGKRIKVMGHASWQA
jgi:hypothetical protein